MLNSTASEVSEVTWCGKVNAGGKASCNLHVRLLCAPVHNEKELVGTYHTYTEIGTDMK